MIRLWPFFRRVASLQAQMGQQTFPHKFLDTVHFHPQFQNVLIRKLLVPIHAHLVV
jgi:hypothetical protein